MTEQQKIKITPAKGRPMLHWVGKKPLDYVKGFPAQLVEVFDPVNSGKIIEPPTYNELKDNWQNLLFHGDNKDGTNTGALHVFASSGRTFYFMGIIKMS